MKRVVACLAVLALNGCMAMQAGGMDRSPDIVGILDGKPVYAGSWYITPAQPDPVKAKEQFLKDIEERGFLWCAGGLKILELDTSAPYTEALGFKSRRWFMRWQCDVPVKHLII
jgi:hypothetical protein